MRDIDRRNARSFAQAPDFAAHLQPQLRVEIAQRLIQQQHLRLDRQGTGQRDALLLTARKLRGLSICARSHLHAFQRFHGSGPPLRARDLPGAESERDILKHRHVGPQGVTLEDHAGVAFVGRKPRHIAIAKPHAAGRRFDESGDEAKHRRLAAARGPKQEEQFARLDRQCDVIDSANRTDVLAQRIKCDRGRHGRGEA
jgi:hypothetical protein